MRRGRRTEREKQAADKKKRRRKRTMMSALLTLRMLTCGRVSDGEHLISPVCTEKKRPNIEWTQESWANAISVLANVSIN